MEKGVENEVDNIRSLQNYIQNLCSDISGIKTIDVNEPPNEVSKFDRLYRYYFLLFVHRIYNYYIINYKDSPIRIPLEANFKKLPLIIRINNLKKEISKSTSDKEVLKSDIEKLIFEKDSLSKKSESYYKTTKLEKNKKALEKKEIEQTEEEQKIDSKKSEIKYIENELKLNIITDAKNKDIQPIDKKDLNGVLMFPGSLLKSQSS
jgi:hypothetical protein